MHPNADEIFQTCTGFNLRLCRLGISDSISPAHSSTLLCYSGFGRSLSLSLALSGRARLDSGDMWRCCGRNATFWSEKGNYLTDNWPSDTMRCNIWNTQLTLAHAFVKWLFFFEISETMIGSTITCHKNPTNHLQWLATNGLYFNHWKRLRLGLWLRPCDVRKAPAVCGFHRGWFGLLGLGFPRGYHGGVTISNSFCMFSQFSIDYVSMNLMGK